MVIDDGVEVREDVKVYTRMISNPVYAEAVELYIDELGPRFYTSPASRHFHHSYEGGLVKHTKEVCELGLKMIENLKLDVDKDLYLMAALLHDAGKVGLYEKNERGDYVHTERKKRMDHSLKPIMDFAEKTRVYLPESVKISILSHMGGFSKTSVYPDDLMSTLLHCADMISSRLDNSPGFHI